MLQVSRQTSAQSAAFQMIPFRTSLELSDVLDQDFVSALHSFDSRCRASSRHVVAQFREEKKQQE